MRFLIAFLCSLAFHLILFNKTDLAFHEVVLVTATSNNQSKMFASIVVQESLEQEEKKKNVKKKEVIEKKVVKKEIKPKKKKIQKKVEEKKVDEIEEDEVNQNKSKSLPNAYTSKTRMAKAADYLNNPHPKYPLLALRRNQEGTVILKVKIDKFGKVVNLLLKESSGYSLLDGAASKSVKSWTFIPAILSNGDKVESTVIVPIEYKLRQ